MTEAEHQANDDYVARLQAIRAELVARVWPAGVEAAIKHDHETVRELVRLKVDIEAIDYTLSHRPPRV